MSIGSFTDISLQDSEKNSIINEIKKMDTNCMTSLQNIGNEIIAMTAYVQSFQNKYTRINADFNIGNAEKAKQKYILMTDFFNDGKVYDTIKILSDKVLSIKFSEILCVSGNDKTQMCKLQTNDIDIQKLNVILTKYKMILRNLVKWIVNVLIERQNYCGFVSINQKEMNNFFENIIYILDPDPPNYYSYIYGTGGLLIGLFIGWLLTYMFFKKNK